MEERISRRLAPFGVEHFGVCSFADCLPLLPCRAAARVPADARSVIVCLFPYWTGDFLRRNVARYAVLPDYHRVAGGILEGLAAGLSEDFPDEQFVPFVDNSPIREVWAARRAGLGVIGRHGMLIHSVFGGHVLLGAVVSTLALPPDKPLEGGCLDCGRCLAACPTGALQADGGLDATRCRSRITQQKGALSDWQAAQIRAGGLAWGCDLCVDACPMNTAAPSPISAFYERPAPVLTAENLGELLAEKPYGYRGRAVLERNLRLL